MWDNIWNSAYEYFSQSGFGQFYWGNAVMIGIGLLFIYLAIKRGFEPLLLVPIGFGILIGNVPYNSATTPVGAYDGPVNEEQLDYYATAEVEWGGRSYAPWEKIENPAIGKILLHEKTADGVRKARALREKSGGRAERAKLEQLGPTDYFAVMVDRTSKLARQGGAKDQPQALGVVDVMQGQRVLVGKPTEQEDGRVVLAPVTAGDESQFPVVVSAERQNPFHASPIYLIARGVVWDFFPPLIFLGLGALTDFGPLLANPRVILLGAAAQFGVFGTVFGALLLGFTGAEAAAVGIIGGADGPTAIYTCSKLAPDLLGAVALSAYSYMAMVPLIQPPIMMALTTKRERLIRMPAPKNVSKTLRIMFPIIGFLICAFIANAALPLMGMLFFGNLTRECGVVDRLFKTAQSQFIDIVTILLGLSVGALTQASSFLTVSTIGIFCLGMVAFSVATASGILLAKLMNVFSKTEINPLIGSAGVSAVPMAARVTQMMAQREDPQNFLLMHAMGPNVAGVIGTAIAAGVLLSYFGN
ncbi:Glutaconyl-CoA decarboxylase subunit beta [Posidoniimonas polymericola]|uniref:Glutaconyl-CoA decarboxylase subunit beta n=1 Tax=Posidoniimonas polymericola TaxID=2528002 RepID=A0A5C5XVN6_9BACT|nr:sodium ion-translocating decarboxylase subunit beta [Posidoniimonas polymericola]TWT66964.1 Glutaconyl-CoA decarboxylase subunit beta [Posidoniimonas polymericola]